MYISIHEIARVCHEANRVYCLTQGDVSQLPWGDAPQWQRDSAIKGVVFHMKNPDAGPEASHVSWLQEKRDTGWVYGPVKDLKLKTHPCMVPFSDLPPSQQRKDVLFRAIVHAFVSD